MTLLRARSDVGQLCHQKTHALTIRPSLLARVGVSVLFACAAAVAPVVYAAPLDPSAVVPGGAVMAGTAGTVTTNESKAAHRTPDDATLAEQCAAYEPLGVNVRTCTRQATMARAAGTRYLNFTAALADGFLPTGQCEMSTSGAMGQHWARADRMAEGPLDPATPQILLYLPAGTGFRLLGAEYEQTASFGGLPAFGPTPGMTGPVSAPPAMFGGKRFDGPMAGHFAAQPWHYDLHVWLWQHNPQGLFAQYNPTVAC